MASVGQERVQRAWEVVETLEQQLAYQGYLELQVWERKA